MNFLNSKNNWKSKWIWDNEEDSPNTWMCFRKSFNMDSMPISAKMFISVDSKYWLWINGHQVVFEGGLNRGPTPDSGYFDSVPIDKYLCKGSNTIAVLVWYWGNEGRNSVDSGKGGLLVQTELDGRYIITDDTWKVKIHPGYGDTKEPYPSYLYGGHNIGFNASMDINGWNLPHYDDNDWKNATEKGMPNCEPWGELYERSIPLIKDYGIKDYINISMTTQGNNMIYTATLPYAAQVTPVFLIKASSAGLKIDVRTDRYSVNGGPGDNNNLYNSHRLEYTTREGIQQFESFDWIFGEEVIYTFPKDIDVISLQYRETGYDTKFAGEFFCNDEFFNKIYEKSKRTLYICMRDNYMDCPDRERGQWIGDVSSQVPQTFYVLDRNSDLLTKKAILDFIYWQKDSVLRGNVPGANCLELPSQSLNAISEIGMIMSYYMNSGDIQVLYQCYDALKNYLWLWDMDETGMVIPREGDWYWFDHGENIDSSILENAWYYSALKATMKIGELIGRIEDKSNLTERMEKIKKNFDRLFWTGKGYSSSTIYDDRANAMAILSGLASSDKWPKIAKILSNVKNSTPYMEGYVLEALFISGYGTIALDRMKERYNTLVYNKNSTLWEDFYVLGTKNHAWSGAPLTILAKYVAGIAPITAGYSYYSVLPQLNHLSSLNITVPSIKGKIKADFTNNDEQFLLRLDSPSETTAIVGIPKYTKNHSSVKRIISNNTVIWENSQPYNFIPEVEYYDEDNFFIKFMVKPGQYIVEAY